MKKIKLVNIFLASCLLSSITIANAQDSSVNPPYTKVMTQERQEYKTPQLVLQRLKEGNLRFVNGKMKNRNLIFQANATATKQHPIAVILNCMDARTPPEIIFDQGIGDVFAVRVGGNILNDDILGSMEFGTQLMGAKLIVVMGHTSCGAIRGACQQAKLGYLTGLLDKIQPAVEQAATEQNTHDCANNVFIDQIAKDNVLLVKKQIQERSNVLASLIQNGQLQVVGAMQDLATGKVTFFEN